MHPYEVSHPLKNFPSPQEHVSGTDHCPTPHAQEIRLAREVDRSLPSELLATPHRGTRERPRAETTPSPRANPSNQRETMTDRQKIIEKWAKLRRLSTGSSNPHEAESARQKASELATEHCLSESDLSEGLMGLAFDDLVASIQQLVTSHPAIPSGLFNTESFLNDLLQSLRSLSDSTKASRLRQVVTIVRTAAFVAGTNATIKEISSRVNAVLTNHSLVL